jgi:hypothetical protein
MDTVIPGTDTSGTSHHPRPWCKTRNPEKVSRHHETEMGEQGN